VALAKRQQEERIAAERREAEERARREAEAKRQAAAEAAKKKAEEEALAKHQQEERIAAERSEAEERVRREAAAKRQADVEVAKAAAEPQKIASLPQASNVDPPEHSVSDPTTLARSLQAELKRVGCDPGAVDGRWGAKAKEALRDFNEVARAALSVELPTEDALETVRAKKERVCALTCSPNEKEKDGRCVARAKSEPTRPKVSEGPRGARGQGAQAKQDVPARNKCHFGFGPGSPANSRPAVKCQGDSYNGYGEKSR